MANGRIPRRRKTDHPDEKYEVAEVRKAHPEGESMNNDGGYRGRGRRGDGRGRNWGWLWSLLALLVLLFFGWLLYKGVSGGDININQNQENNQNQQFAGEKKSANFQTSVPAQGNTIPAPPINVVIATNTNATNQSSITVNKDGKDYSAGSLNLESNGQVLRRAVQSSAPDGIYTVNYNICGSDNRCQDGNYQFRVDRTATQDFRDLTGSNNVTVGIANGQFNPSNIIVKRGTRITWQNNDGRSHTLYPGREGSEKYFPNLSSGAISSGGNFSLTISETGYFPYFAKDGQVINGQIVVRD